MSRNSSNEKPKKGTRSGSNKNIFQSTAGNQNSNTNLRIEEIDPNLLMRKSTQRIASQGVKVLVNREKGIDIDSDVNMNMDSSRNNTNSITVNNIINPPLNIINTTSKNVTQNVPTPEIKRNINVSSYMMPNPINPPHNQPQSTNQPQQRQIFSKRDDKIINRPYFEKMLSDKLRKEGLEMKNVNVNDIANFVNNGLESYLKNVLEKLITISRLRNVNLNLYSKQSEKNPVFKIHTYNPNPQSEFGYSPYKDFSILFTRNMKNTMNMLEEYEELNLKKLRQERVTLYKNKLDEISALKEQEKDEKANVNLNNINNIKSSQVKPRVRKRDTMLKRVRSTLAKSQKRDEMARHKKETQNTLETFLDNKPRSVIGGGNLSQHRFETESNIAESHNMETYTKLSEVSKSEAPGTIAADGTTNEINLSVFKYSNPTQNIKIQQSNSIKRRITLKDLVNFLEGDRKTPMQNLILHRAVLKLNQSYH